MKNEGKESNNTPKKPLAERNNKAQWLFSWRKIGIQLLLGYKDLVKRWTTKPDTAERHVREIKTGFLARNLLLFNYSHYLFQMFSNEVAGGLDLESSL